MTTNQLHEFAYRNAEMKNGIYAEVNKQQRVATKVCYFNNNTSEVSKKAIDKMAEAIQAFEKALRLY